MKNKPKPLTLDEIIAQGGYQNQERKWKRQIVHYKGLQYEDLCDDKGFFYGPDDQLYHTKTDTFDDGGPFTGITYELYPKKGGLRSYQVYEQSDMVESWCFHKNGNLEMVLTFAPEYLLLEYDENGTLTSKNGKPVEIPPVARRAATPSPARMSTPAETRPPCARNTTRFPTTPCPGCWRQAS